MGGVALRFCLVLGRVLMVGLLLRKRLLWMHLRGFEACSDGGVPLRKRRPGMHLKASLLVVALAV